MGRDSAVTKISPATRSQQISCARAHARTHARAPDWVLKYPPGVGQYLLDERSKKGKERISLQVVFSWNSFKNQFIKHTFKSFVYLGLQSINSSGDVNYLESVAGNHTAWRNPRVWRGAVGVGGSQLLLPNRTSSSSVTPKLAGPASPLPLTQNIISMRKRKLTFSLNKTWL